MSNILWKLKYRLASAKRKALIFPLLTKRFVRIVTSFTKKYPDTIQLPITYKCNFDCVMCGMRNLISNEDFSAKELEKILSDKLFTKIDAVGLNGGEPFLKQDLEECVRILIRCLPNLKNIFLISNGYFTDLIEKKLKSIYKTCKNNNVKLNISFSIDGVGDMQDYMRGHNNAWDNVIKTIDLIKNNKDKYYDSLGVVCTVTRFNVYNLEEVEIWSKCNNVKVRYNIATVNARIDNAAKLKDFSILNDDKAKMHAREFFYKKAIEDFDETYFGLFLYLYTGKRYAICPCQYNRWVTLTPDSNISYCATYSKELGNALEQSSYDIFNGNLKYLEYIKNNHCDGCSHYISQLNCKGLYLYYNELLRNKKVMI